MRSRVARSLILTVLALALVGGTAVLATARDSSGQAVEDEAVSARAMTGAFDLVTHGTAWVPQTRARFSKFMPVGWGMITQVKAAGVGNQWVHMPLSYPSYIEGAAPKLAYVEFCAQSSNGVATKPIAMDIWDGGTSISHDVIAWAPDNAYHCFGHNYAAPAWHADLGISVLLYFANTTDTITLYKAWAHVVP